MNTSVVKRVAPVVEAYCRKAGIGTERPFGTFWNRLSKRFGIAGEAAGTAIDRRSRDEPVDIYDLKNNSLDLSLAVASQYYGDLYRQYLSWFVREKLPSPSAILDVGCENGAFSCYRSLNGAIISEVVCRISQKQYASGVTEAVLVVALLPLWLPLLVIGVVLFTLHRF